MVQSQSNRFAGRLRGSGRVLVVAILAVSTACLILSRCISIQRTQPQSLLGNPFEPDSQDEQHVNQADQSERLTSYSPDFMDAPPSVGSAGDTSRDTDDVRHLRRASDFGDGGAASAQQSGTNIRGIGGDTLPLSSSGNLNYNVNIINGQSKRNSGALAYITSPVAGYGSDLVGGDITSSLNRNIRDIQKLQQQFSAPEHARRRSKLALLRKDDKMLQSTLLDTLKLQERQMNAETAATKRLAVSIQHLRGRTQQELGQRATTSQLDAAIFDLKRLAAMQSDEYESLMRLKAQPGPPGLPGPAGPPGLNGRDGINGSPGSIQQLVPVRRHRLSSGNVAPGHWADEGLFQRKSSFSAAPALSFLPKSLPPAIPPPYEPFPNRVETLPNGATYQTHFVSPDGQRSWDIHPPIPSPHRRCQDDDLSCNSQNNPNTWGSARKDSNAGARSGMKQALAHMKITSGQEEAPLALAAPSRKALADAGQLGVPAATAALRRLRLARERLQMQQRKPQPLVATSAAALPASLPFVPPLLHAELQERRRALSNADIVMPSTVLRGKSELAHASLIERSDSSGYMRRTGLRHRLAEVQRNHDNGGFFESPASVVDE